ncbi:MAG: glycosyltransferase [Verrucomicrobia bacterium]|nr:glycosyltransferase [Verrucomicrobiota bacterium]
MAECASKQAPTVLILVRHFVPAYKAGGPVRTLEAMIHHLAGAYRFKVLACDRDLGDTSPFPGIQVNQWNRVGAAEVLYLPRGPASPLHMLWAIKNTNFDLLYANSFFDPLFTLVPLLARRFGLRRNQSVILAPRGELSPGALAQKRAKKRAYLALALRSGLYRNVTWHASSSLERAEITQSLCQFGGVSANELRLHVALDLACLAIPAVSPLPHKSAGRLRAVFISRISPKKNLLAAIELLVRVSGNVSLDIYGAVDDQNYWRNCQQAIAQLGGATQVTYKGAIQHQEVVRVLSGYDVFLFPTLGENFGHVILEAMIAGCPVVTSDQTPWRDLAAKKAGWDLPLEAPDRFVEVLQSLVDMGEQEHRRLREGARALGAATANDEQTVRDNERLFADVLAAGDGPRAVPGSQQP